MDVFLSDSLGAERRTIDDDVRHHLLQSERRDVDQPMVYGQLRKRQWKERARRQYGYNQWCSAGRELKRGFQSAQYIGGGWYGIR